MSRTERPLKIWNGRGACINRQKLPPELNVGRGSVHVYICAYSKADAARLINQFNGYEGDRAQNYNSELTNYFSAGCWGIYMEGVKQERGLWLSTDEYECKHKTPVRVI